VTLLEELRNLDVADPGLWSRRVSAVLACALFALIAIAGLRIRVYGQVAPRLQAATADAAGLERQLADTHGNALAARAIGEQADQAEARLKAAAVWIPAQAPELDLPVALAAGPNSAALQAVQPWEQAANRSAELQHAGAELELSGSYAELVAFLDHALHSMPLRELIELKMESPGPEDRGRLRATARLAAYFGGPDAARLLRTMPENPASLNAAAFPVLPRLDDRLSPFGVSPPDGGGPHGGERRAEAAADASRERGFVRVGNRRYAIMQNEAGRLGLQGGEG